MIIEPVKVEPKEQILLMVAPTEFEHIISGLIKYANRVSRKERDFFEDLHTLKNKLESQFAEQHTYPWRT